MQPEICEGPALTIVTALLMAARHVAAAKELERRVGAGFKGAAFNGHIRGRYLNDSFFWPIFKAAEALGAPMIVSLGAIGV